MLTSLPPGLVRLGAALPPSVHEEGRALSRCAAHVPVGAVLLQGSDDLGPLTPGEHVSLRVLGSYAAVRVPTAPTPGSAAARRTATAVEATASSRAPGTRRRSALAHCARPWAWERTVARLSDRAPGAATRQWWTARTTSPTMTTPGAENVSASTVALTPPSTEFSSGASARSTRPSCTARTTSCTVSRATWVPSAPVDSSASWEFVPSGPR